VRIAGAFLATTVALALQTTVLAGFTIRGTVALDLLLVVVVFVALRGGPTLGLLTGTFAGLVQDSLSSGVIGIGGLSKTIVGFTTGLIGRQFIVSEPLPRFVVFFAATIVNEAAFMGLYTLLGLKHFDAPYVAVASQALGNAVVGIVAFQIAELLPGAVERRRAAKSRVRR
jgi:rod shape-determining protein MreD